LGKTTKLALKFEQTSKIYKSNNKFSKSIKVHVKVPAKKVNESGKVEKCFDETTYKFYNFSDRDISFKYIIRVWRNASPYANSDDESEASEEEPQG
jgi:hypothetical protein